ncbi:MAG: hypothetical protein ACLP7P_04075 [Rhodomicrobium sp.]
MTLRYTPGQLRAAILIPQETYRHWKKALPPLSRGVGHSPCFTAGDILGVAVVRILTVDFAVRVGALSVIANGLFEACNSVSWPTLERSKLIVELSIGRLQIRPELENVILESPAFIIPLRSLVGRLREALLTEGVAEDPQQILRFPPTPLPSNIAAASTRGRL